MNVDLRSEVPTLLVPAYFVQGRYDYTTSYPLARDYFREARSPGQRRLHVRTLGTQPCVRGAREELRVLREDVAAGKTHLADAE